MKTLVTGSIMGLFGAAAVLVASTLHWPTWVMFMAWVSFYLFGKSLTTSIPVFIQIVLGMVMGVLIQMVGMRLSSVIGEVGFPAAIFLFIGSLAFIAKIKPLNNIPAWFVGLIIFFGVHPPIEVVPLTSLVIPIIFGFLFAWANDTAIQVLAQRFETK